MSPCPSRKKPSGWRPGSASGRRGPGRSIRWPSTARPFSATTPTAPGWSLTGNLACPLAGKRILLLGAGGASRGVIAPLLAERPASLFIANRSADKALALAAAFVDVAPVEAGSFGETAGKSFDLVINATSASLAGEALPLPPGIFAAGSLAYDMMYGKGETPFLRQAREQGAGRCADGLGMLVEQAAEAFRVWRGLRPATAPVLARLRAGLAG